MSPTPFSFPFLPLEPPAASHSVFLFLVEETGNIGLIWAFINSICLKSYAIRTWYINPLPCPEASLALLWDHTPSTPLPLEHNHEYPRPDAIPSVPLSWYQGPHVLLSTSLCEVTSVGILQLPECQGPWSPCSAGTRTPESVSGESLYLYSLWALTEDEASLRCGGA